MIVESSFLDKLWISYEFPKGIVTKPPWAPLGGAITIHNVDFSSGPSLQSRKS
jgi:hypothetical protein